MMVNAWPFALCFAGENCSAQLDGVSTQMDDTAVAGNSLDSHDFIRVSESIRGSYVSGPVALS